MLLLEIHLEQWQGGLLLHQIFLQGRVDLVDFSLLRWQVSTDKPSWFPPEEVAEQAAEQAAAADLAAESAALASDASTEVIEGGRLDFREEPSFASESLGAGFNPDPYTLEMVSGGEVDVSYLGGDCTGYAAVAPDYRLHWTGNSSELRIFFAAEDGGDTILLVNLPDGSWACNDDGSDGLDPMLVFETPEAGQYDVCVATYEAGAFVSGRLQVTERRR